MSTTCNRQTIFCGRRIWQIMFGDGHGEAETYSTTFTSRIKKTRKKSNQRSKISNYKSERSYLRCFSSDLELGTSHRSTYLYKISSGLGLRPRFSHLVRSYHGYGSRQESLKGRKAGTDLTYSLFRHQSLVVYENHSGQVHV